MTTDYYDLAALADNLFAVSDDDEEKLAGLLDELDAGVRRELLSSDLLNAYQVFYYYFRETPDELVQDRLLLHAASDLRRGLLIEEYDIYEVILAVEDDRPVIVVTDGDEETARFSGRSAYRDVMAYLGTEA
ncbi:hypothetical protein ABH15_08555 [Methanoculleus taiwanensis]|uniref:Uncharacterized protein n=1 Tax=Methanoculleus taiwanensis TaxID=1550565 RepID=A0A498H265_9EURY|nr:hypothetical protein [Methanoculleus taiwanensis]RXE56190.1 hypothetical protein ABH15_08555 [Methanoculleus taiwanensis]